MSDGVHVWPRCGCGQWDPDDKPYCYVLGPRCMVSAQAGDAEGATWRYCDYSPPPNPPPAPPFPPPKLPLIRTASPSPKPLSRPASSEVPGSIASGNAQNVAALLPSPSPSPSPAPIDTCACTWDNGLKDHSCFSNGVNVAPRCGCAAWGVAADDVSYCYVQGKGCSDTYEASQYPGAYWQVSALYPHVQRCNVTPSRLTSRLW